MRYSDALPSPPLRAVRRWPRVLALILLLAVTASVLAAMRLLPAHALEQYRAGRFERAAQLLQLLVSAGFHRQEMELALADSYLRLGRNLDAARTYRGMLLRGPQDGQALRALLALYGLPDLPPDFSLELRPQEPPAQTQLLYRTSGDYFQALRENRWQNVYLSGVNIGPARPGEFPSTASREFSTYYQWLEQIGTMNGNTVRIYSVLPPAFYQALLSYNQSAAAPLWLIQEVWIHDETQDLYDPASRSDFERELRNVIDLLHGNADIPCRPGANCGIYTADVSPYVIGIGVGREIEPVLALRTNRLNPGKRSYQGRYVGISEGNPSEVWFAQLCDYAVQYEMSRYNAQRPLTVVNWPPLDPLFHPTEATYAEELMFRKRDGERVSEILPEDASDVDVVSLDIMRFKTGPEFQAGLFALYHVYQHWPDFLFHEPSYAEARDEQGSNRYLGYLRQLKAVHKNFPLLIGEFGLSTSLGVAHLHPDGWHNGGFTEQHQAELLVRFDRNIRDTQCAGGIVFAWQDEWFKRVHDYYTSDFEIPRDHDPLWDNQLDPEEHFGIVAYEPAAQVPLLRGLASDWEGAQLLYVRGAGDGATAQPSSPLRQVHAMVDYAYFYLRLDVEPQALDSSSWNYWIALNTLPGRAGSRVLPEVGVRLDTGANYLVQLAAPDRGRILVTRNYNPNEFVFVPGREQVKRIWRKLSMEISLLDQAPFEEILTEANQPRYARDGRFFPPKEYSRSPLPYGTADRNRPEYSNHALWRVDGEQGMIELRLPWALLLVADPSSLKAFFGTDASWKPQATAMEGITVAVFALDRPKSGGWQLTGSLPAVAQGRISQPLAMVNWKPWGEDLQYRPYFKLSYYALQREWGSRKAEPPGR